MVKRLLICTIRCGCYVGINKYKNTSIFTQGMPTGTNPTINKKRRTTKAQEAQDSAYPGAQQNSCHSSAAPIHL